MKWSFNQLIAALLLPAATGCSHPPQKPVNIAAFERLLLDDLHYRIPEDSTWYLVISPRSCASCSVYYIRWFSRYSTGHPLVMIASAEHVAQLKTVRENPDTRYITQFNQAQLSNQRFLKNDVAFCLTVHGEVVSVEPIDKAADLKYGIGK